MIGVKGPQDNGGGGGGGGIPFQNQFFQYISIGEIGNVLRVDQVINTLDPPIDVQSQNLGNIVFRCRRNGISQDYLYGGTVSGLVGLGAGQLDKSWFSPFYPQEKIWHGRVVVGTNTVNVDVLYRNDFGVALVFGALDGGGNGLITCTAWTVPSLLSCSPSIAGPAVNTNGSSYVTFVPDGAVARINIISYRMTQFESPVTNYLDAGGGIPIDLKITYYG